MLCVGDLMLDEFVYGEVSRISPEAPTPVIAVKRTEVMIGGAGNVARNLVALGTRCIFVERCRSDAMPVLRRTTTGKHRLIEFHLVVDAARQTTRKVRFVSEHHSPPICAPIGKATPTDGRRRQKKTALIAHAVKAMKKRQARWCCPITPRAR